MERFPELREVQALVWRLLTTPEGVRQGAAELVRRGELASEDLGFLVRVSGKLGPTRALQARIRTLCFFASNAAAARSLSSSTLRSPR